MVYTIKNNKAVYSKKNSEHSSALCEIGRGIYSDSVIFEQRSLGGETWAFKISIEGTARMKVFWGPIKGLV